MMKKIPAIAFLSFLVVSCASTTQYINSSEEVSSEAPNAKIYVIRPTYFGSAVKMKIYQDNELIGKLGPKNYLSWDVSPEKGDVTIVSASENKDSLTISPKAGETYYIRQKVNMGFTVARTDIEFIEEDVAIKMLSDLRNQ